MLAARAFAVRAAAPAPRKKAAAAPPAKPRNTRQRKTPPVPPLEALLAAGAAWGRLSGRATPAMSRFLFVDRRRKYDVIDLLQTRPLLQQALDALAATAAAGRPVLFVGTSPVAQEAVAIAAQRCGSPFVVSRWVGGTLTNFRSISRAIASLDAPPLRPTSPPLAAPGVRPASAAAARKAAAVAARAAARATRRVGGLRGLATLPGAIFVVDAAAEKHALAEAASVGVPTVAICDSDTAHPDCIDFPVPANAHAPAAVRLLCELAARAVLAGRGAEAPEAAWQRQRDAAAAEAAAGDDVLTTATPQSEEDDKNAERFAFYGPWGLAPLRSALSGVGRPRGRVGAGKRHRQTRGGSGGHAVRGPLGRTQRRLGAGSS